MNLGEELRNRKQADLEIKDQGVPSEEEQVEQIRIRKGEWLASKLAKFYQNAAETLRKSVADGVYEVDVYELEFIDFVNPPEFAFMGRVPSSELIGKFGFTENILKVKEWLKENGLEKYHFRAEKVSSGWCTSLHYYLTVDI